MPALPPATLDVRLVSPHRKGLTVAATIGVLAPGESLVLVDDRDPRPLCSQFDAELRRTFEWEYLEHGPAIWRVRVTRT